MLAPLWTFVSRLLHDEAYQRSWLQKILVSFALVVLLHLWNSRPVRIKNKQPPEATERKESKKKEHLSTKQTSVTEEAQVTDAAAAAATPSKETKPGNDNEEESNSKITKGGPKSKPLQSADKSKQKSNKREKPVTASTVPAPPPFLYNGHPGMEEYWHWHDVETSLYRIYTIATRQPQDDSSSFNAVPPFNPSSRRGNVQIHLQVTNGMDATIHVFWIDYKGKEIPKGTIEPRQTWTQTTYIDHPWVFRTGHLQQQLLLYYIPYRVIPTTFMAPTTEKDDSNQAVQRFTLQSPRYSTDACRVDDPILPFPASSHFVTPQLAVEWALLHCTRTGFYDWDLLLQCGSKVVQNPDNPKYQSLRIANPHFGPRLWQTAARGVLLGAGFYENHGWVQVGGVGNRERVQELAVWIWMINQWINKVGRDANSTQQQPVGADGFGRAGFGRAGDMS